MTLKEQLEHKIDSVEKQIKTLQNELPALNSALEEESREIPSRLWKCRYTECDSGLGLAGKDSCPGNPEDEDCDRFTTRWGDRKERNSKITSTVGDMRQLLAGLNEREQIIVHLDEDGMPFEYSEQCLSGRETYIREDWEGIYECEPDPNTEKVLMLIIHG